jgi:hypothetical protein
MPPEYKMLLPFQKEGRKWGNPTPQFIKKIKCPGYPGAYLIPG